jgi:hypothetical protein
MAGETRRTDETDQIIEEGNHFGNEESKGRHSKGEAEPNGPVRLGRVLEMSRSSKCTNETEFGSEMSVDDRSGQKSRNSD